ncbi:hypothetical protein GCM10023216_06150 [Isoptericola chiayiensis]|uniref:Phosphoesterase PA-phosphatase related protein n=1 Tax=Isoptericola chiayiensis TaxID=579446 RepID=A0ABP8Y3V4_9MICO|nr:membrane-associated phospholipid phosphatase [Isoptericola chiayiensis]
MLAAAGAALVYGLAVHTPAGRSVDGAVLGLVAGWAGTPDTSAVAAALGVIRGALPFLLAAAVGVLGMIGVARRRWRGVVAAAVAIPCAIASSLVLRDLLLSRPSELAHPVYAHNTFPSTHVTAVAALCLAAWWLRPTSWNDTVTAYSAGLIVLLAAVASVATHAHRPSDTLGSVFLVAAWGAMTVYALRLRPD